MATTNKVKGWTGVLMTEDSSSHWPIKRRHVYSETSRRVGLEFVCIFGHDAIAHMQSELIATIPANGYKTTACASLPVFHQNSVNERSVNIDR